MDVSVVEEFTVQLAAMLTGRRDVEKLISQAEETGNFFEICGTNGIWRCRWPMRKSMQQRLRRRKTAEQIERLYYSAGLYYEINDQIPEALDMYEKYNDMDSISRLLTANARKILPVGITLSFADITWSFRTILWKTVLFLWRGSVYCSQC